MSLLNNIQLYKRLIHLLPPPHGLAFFAFGDALRFRFFGKFFIPAAVSAFGEYEREREKREECVCVRETKIRGRDRKREEVPARARGAGGN